MEMQTYVVLLRGINVGGKNKLPMADLKSCLKEIGYSNVVTYIASGNVILQSEKAPSEIKAEIERILPQTFKLDSELIKILVLTVDNLKQVIENKPVGFGEQPEKYHSDVIFLIDIAADEAIKSFDPREGVDNVWQGDGVIYSQRLSAELTKSRLNKVIASPHYKSMTIRNWNTTRKLLEIVSFSPRTSTQLG